MSRTDKTRPYWVKKKDYPILYPRLEDHDGWSFRTYEWWRGEFRCPCKMCGWDSYGTPLRKKQRAESKKIIREQMED